MHPQLDGQRLRANRACVACNQRGADAWKKRHPEWVKRKDARRDKKQWRARDLMKKYGITLSDFEAMLAAQRGRCGICKTNTPGGKNWHVDHDHRTGRVRELLCCHCNVMLAQAKDDPTRLESGAAYLRKFGK